jgi:hypothetical protein
MLLARFGTTLNRAKISSTRTPCYPRNSGTLPNSWPPRQRTPAVVILRLCDEHSRRTSSHQQALSKPFGWFQERSQGSQPEVQTLSAAPFRSILRGALNTHSYRSTPLFYRSLQPPSPRAQLASNYTSPKTYWPHLSRIRRIYLAMDAVNAQPGELV